MARWHEGVRPDELEPYTTRAVFSAAATVEDATEMVALLLESVARGCEEAGCSIIGHVKAHASTAGSRFHCNLTSIRGGAVCGFPEGGAGTGGPRLESGATLGLDLAVLVYGLPRQVIDDVVDDSMRVCAGRFPGEWRSHPSSSHEHRH